MKTINAALMWTCKILLMLMVPTMTIIVFAQVVMRYVFSSPFTWAEEAARYLLVWISCIGAVYGLREGVHIGLIFFRDKFPRLADSASAFFIHLTLLAFFGVCTFEGARLALAQWSQVSPGMGLRMTWALASVPASSAAMIMFTLELFLEDLKSVLAGKRPRKSGEAHL